MNAFKRKYGIAFDRSLFPITPRSHLFQLLDDAASARHERMAGGGYAYHVLALGMLETVRMVREVTPCELLKCDVMADLKIKRDQMRAADAV